MTTGDYRNLSGGRPLVPSTTPQWSWDGTLIVFTFLARRGPPFSLATMRSDGSNVRRWPRMSLNVRLGPPV